MAASDLHEPDPEEMWSNDLGWVPKSALQAAREKEVTKLQEFDTFEEVPQDGSEGDRLKRNSQPWSQGWTPWKQKYTERSGKAWGEKEVSEKSRTVPNENKAVATGFKEDSAEEYVKTVIEKTITISGRKGVKYTIKCPAIPIKHAFIEFRDSDVRYKYIRSAKMQRV